MAESGKVNYQFDLNIYEKQITSLSEDIHWLLLISGFILFEINADLNECLIPNEIMKYSIKWSKYIDNNLINRLFSTLNNQITNVPLISTSTQISVSLIDTRLNATDQCDPIISLFFNSFQLCELETQMGALNMLSYLSPQVASTLMWFLKEMVRSYLFMKEKNYDELSSTLQALMGIDTECGVLILNFFLRKLSANFYVWSAENNTTTQTAKLLLEIVRNKEMSKILFQNEQFWSISKIAVVNEMPWLLLPSNVKKLIIKSLVVSCSNSGAQQSNDSQSSLIQAHFFNTILKPIADRFDALMLLKPSEIHVESCIKEVMSLIETFNGILEGSSKNLVKDLIAFVLPRLQQAVQLLDAYHNYGEIVELILGLFNCVIEKFLVHLNDDMSMVDAKNQIYHSFLCLIQVFSKHNSGSVLN